MLHLICPGCGAALQKPENLKGNTFQCEHCKNVVVIKEVSGEPKQSPQNILELAVFSEKTGDYIQAYRHYTRLIEIDPKSPTFWMGKARNAGYISSFQNQRINEMLESFRHGISLAEKDEEKALEKDAGEFIFQRCCDYLDALKSTHTLYITQIIDGMIQASEYLPYDLDIVDMIIVTCRKKLPSYGPPEIREYKKDVLKLFIEKKKELFPEYFVHIEAKQQQYSEMFDSLLFVMGLFLILFIIAIVLFRFLQ